jgi:hypothetical protein
MHQFAMRKQPSRLTLSKTVLCENDRRHPTTSRAQLRSSIKHSVMTAARMAPHATTVRSSLVA